ncbi:receptor-like protein kinase ANXUR1 isoform X1 [Neltuma alba]|uniref:receptor-like protein kinase ANXUR1 isoform X1 n=1 Tax=Neltuma alba TaxID=207710 RepID=UPI0010A5349B|nr:receptor-like protein kinase ANXUR1 isoform X1 [Prosopis alba]
MGIFHKCFGGPASTSRKHPSTTIEYLCHRFSLSQLRKSTDNFDDSRIIGEGPFGVGYRARISVNGQMKDLIVKRLRREAANSSYGLLLYKNDIIFRCQLHHPNLVSLVGFCDDQNEMIVVYDYAPNGSLYQQLYETEAKPAIRPWKKRLEISIGVARGLHYLHSGTKRTIIHRDITPFAILLGEHWIPKLNFFGFSIKGPKFSEKDVKPIQLESIEGPVGYIAPECISGTNVTYKSDVYSFGAVLLELICGKTLFQIVQHKGRHVDKTASVIPFTTSVVKEVRNWEERGNAGGIIDQSLMGEIAAECWKLYMDITESCLSEDPDERPDMGDVEVQLERLLQLQEEAVSMILEDPSAKSI